MNETKFWFLMSIGFILLVDVFTSFVQAVALKNMKKETIKRAITTMLHASTTFEQIVADSQFDKPTFYQYFAKKDIHLRTKPPMQHVNFAESRIAIVKRRLFSAIRAKKTNQWPQFLPKIITGINAVPTASIGGLRPVDCRTKDTDNLIISRLKQTNRFQEPLSVDQQRSKMKEYVKNRKNEGFQVGDLVMLPLQHEGRLNVPEKETAIKVSALELFYCRAILKYICVCSRFFNLLFLPKC